MAHRMYDEFGHDQIQRQADGGFLVNAAWLEDDWVYRTILSYGEHIEVLEPENIREIIKEKAQKIMKKYL